MLTLLGRAESKRRDFCDRLSRRGFLTIGGLAMGGLSLPQLLAIDERSGKGRSHKALINIYLPGGPSHIDLWDLKPDAPREIRGEFRPIETNVPGIQVCELFPRLARMMDKFTIIRSLVGSEGAHDAYQCMTGHTRRSRPPAGGWPNLGAWISSLRGPVDPGLPPAVSLMYTVGNRTWGESYGGGFLGTAHAPVNLIGSKGVGPASDMVLDGVSLERLSDRRRLLGSLDRFRAAVDAGGALDGIDQYRDQALSILTSSGLVEALDLSKEDPRVLERYGEDDPVFQRDGAPRMVRNFLIARRLVEAGARVVSLNYSRWDWHGGDGLNFPSSRDEFPRLDRALSALVTDLQERGLDRDVTVIVWGEFGRTPKINTMNSRDHWPQVSTAIIAGGGLQMGQVIGATNRYGEHPVDRPVSFQEVFATLYHSLGIDVQTTTVVDRSGRPQYLLDAGVQPIAELI
jgi:hypothetical protein